MRAYSTLTYHLFPLRANPAVTVGRIKGTHMKIPSTEEMLKAGVHFGHQTSRWHPKMAPYIFSKRAGVHVIDLDQTQAILENVLPEITNIAAAGKTILFVSTKPQAREIIKAAATDCGMPYLTNRWIGGLLTNFNEIKKIFARYHRLKAEQASGELEKYTKKEQLDFTREMAEIELNLGGLVDVKVMPDYLFIPALQNEKTAVTEANKMGVKIIGVCDTNANPDKADIIIPANDDAVKSISMIVDLVGNAIGKGKATYDATVIKEATKDAPKAALKKERKKPTAAAEVA